MIDVKKIWQDTLGVLSGEVTAVVYSLWLECLTPLSVKDNALILVAPTQNTRQKINKVNKDGTSYKDLIKGALSKSKSPIVDVEIITEEEKADFAPDDNYSMDFESEKIVPQQKPSQFISRYTFNNFVVGESNKLAFHAAQSVAQNPGSAEGFLNFNPLFIYGDVGLGKTHLLHAIGNYMEENMPQFNVLYVPTEKLTNDYVEAISNTSSNDKSSFNFRAFREKYRSVDVLMIDDVQFLQKKTGLQDVVFHIFNDLFQSGKQIILTSDRPPIEIGTLEARLRTRFEGGLLADIGSPNLEMRIAIIKKKLILQKLNVSDDVIYYLAEQYDSNVRELEGALSKVLFYCSLINKPFPDLETAKEALKNHQQTRSGIDSSDIINSVCSYCKISKTDLISKKKTKDIAEARMFAIYLVNELLSLPLATIGQIFGGRDHTTIIYSRDKVSSMIKENKDVARKIKDIKDMLNV